MKYLIFSVCILLLACNQTPQVQTGPDAEKDEHGLTKVDYSGFDKAFVDAKAKLANYKSFMFAPLDLSNIEIIQPDNRVGLNSEWKFTEKDAQQWSDAYMKAVEEVFGKKLPIANSPGPGVALVKSQITRFAPNAPKYDSIDRGARDKIYSRTSGNMTIETQFIDSQANNLLANITDNRDLGNDTTMRQATYGQFGMDLRNAFYSWARNLGDRLSKAAIE